MTFRVFEYDADYKKHDTGKEFTITLDDSNNRMTKMGYGSSTYIERRAILLTMFEKVYNFSYESGFQLSWNEELITGDIHWREKCWFIKRVG